MSKVSKQGGPGTTGVQFVKNTERKDSEKVGVRAENADTQGQVKSWGCYSSETGEPLMFLLRASGEYRGRICQLIRCWEWGSDEGER